MMCEGKVALVTGGAGNGMGRSIALTLAREGASVVVNYRSSVDSASEIVAHIARNGQNCFSIQADVFTAEGCKKIIDEVNNQYGRLDICIINPGGEWRPGPIQKIDPESSIQDLTREIKPLFFLMPLVLPGMFERKWGRLIGISMDTSDSITPGYGYSYCVAKAARTAAIKMMRKQAWQNGVNVNIIAPGPVKSIETFEEAIEQCAHGPAWRNRKSTSAQDISEGVAFLCSEAGGYITDTEIRYAYRV